jgi:hypothetical protein
MSIIDGMNYSQWRKRNTNIFNKLSNKQKKEIREHGYFNSGWHKVLKSWKVLSAFIEIPTLFDIKLKKGDISGALNQCILGAEKAQEIALQAIETLNNNHNALNKVVKTTLNKYQKL